MEKFVPLQDWLLIRLAKVEKETESGFVISDKKLTPTKAEVVKSPKECVSEKGDTIYLEKQNLHEIKIDGEVWHAIRERFVIGIIKK